MTFIFWSCIFAVFYAYLGYPFCLYIISRLKSRVAVRGNKSWTPRVSLIISAYNEEAVMQGKIVNCLSLNYPKELLEIVVVSDGSEDKTDDIVLSFSGEGVVLRRYEGRIGKTACLNMAVPLSKGDIVVFSDANSDYPANSIMNLVDKFSDPDVGLVTGYTKYVSKRNNDGPRSASIYSRIEKITKQLETKIGSCVGADGAIFAMRKSLYRQLNENDINDFVVPLQVVREGFRAVLEPKAYCIEEATKSISNEFKRQTRITNRTLRAIYNNLDVLNVFRFGIFSFQLVSHKVMKFLVPYFIMVLIVVNLVLISAGWAYIGILGLQVICYILASVGYISTFAKKRLKVVSLCHEFVWINLAIIYGWVTFFGGERYKTWSSTR